MATLVGLTAITSPAATNMTLHVSSSAFSEGQPIPEKYTCDGLNVSPPIQWSGTPGDTKGIAILCEDPDAPSGSSQMIVTLFVLPGAPLHLIGGETF